MTTNDLSTSRRGNRGGRRAGARRLGTLVALCLAAVLAAALAVVPVGLSAQGVPTWVPGVSDLSTPGQDASYARAAVDANGAVTVVWQRSDGTNQMVQASTRKPDSPWSTPTDLSAPGQDAWHPQVAAAADGTVTVVWESSQFLTTNNTVYATTRLPGGTWTAPTDLSGPGQHALSPQVAAARDGTTTAVWVLHGTSTIVQATTRAPDGTWPAATDLSALGQDGYDPQVAAAPDGTTTAVWVRSDGTVGQLQAATRSPAGTWTPPADISEPGRQVHSPELAVAADGAPTAVWVWRDGYGSTVQTATRGPGGAWTAPVALSAPQPSAWHPHVAAASDGTTTAVWQGTQGPDRTNMIVRAATRNQDGTWTVGPILSDPLSGPGLPVDFPDVTAADTTTAVWMHWDGANYVLAAATRSPGGVWTTLTNLSAPGQSIFEPQVVAAADGTTTAVWSRFDGAHWVVQARDVDHDAPLLGAISIPATGTVGQSLLFEADAVDASSNPTTITWDFGDGATLTGGSVTHAYASVGTYSVKVMATDAVGNTISTTAGTVTITAGAVTITAAPRAPEITRLKLTRTTIYATHHPRATRAVISLTAPAKVVLSFKKPGTRAQRKTLRLDAGTTRVRLTTRLTRTARLKPGAYKVIAVATNAAGESAARTARLRVIR
jgi:hypothetical protein